MKGRASLWNPLTWWRLLFPRPQPPLIISGNQRLRTVMHLFFPEIAADYAALGMEWKPDANLDDACELVMNACCCGASAALQYFSETKLADIKGWHTKLFISEKVYAGWAQELPEAICLAMLDLRNGMHLLEKRPVRLLEA